MISSGYIIGQIIDEFSALGEQAKIRNHLGFSDLSVYSENFFKDIINIVEGYKLVHANQKRANEPGIDLIDKKNRIAIQVTTTNTSEKIKHTLQQINENHLKKYDKYRILIIGERQKKYAAVNTALKNRKASKIHPDLNFDLENHIIDLTDLARKIVGLDLKVLQTLHNYIQEQVARVKIEFEVPNKKGNYKTSGFKLWEQLPTPKPATGKNFAKWNSSPKAPSDDEIEEAKAAIDELTNRLRRLPRITREFFAVLFERSEQVNGRFRDHQSLLFPTVEKTYPKAQSELDLLLAENLIDIDRSDLGHGPNLPPEIGLRMGLGYSDLEIGFYDFIKANKLSIRKVIVELDFSKF